LPHESRKIIALNPDLPKPAAKAAPRIDTLSIPDLLALRAQIDAALPAAALADLDLESELVVQYQTIKELQNRTLGDDETPANQKAQVANACAAVLGQLVKMQAEFYTAERFKSIEGLMVKALKTLPLEHAEQFLRDYEALGG
jgi:hypothetical protein